MKRGFVLGKFMPLHAGHVFLLDVAARMVEELTVLVCTRNVEPIDGDLRARWVRESVKPNVRVRHLHRDVPQEPEDHPDFWDIWGGIVREFHPEQIDLVFGSESYVKRLAEVAGAAPFVVDEPRGAVPVSATMVRDDPAAHWDFVPAAVRPHYQRRMCLMGPESTGKSTYAMRLAEAHGTLAVPEYGRTHDAMRGEAAWGEADFLAIAGGHAAIRAETCARAGRLVFEDTDALQTVIWAEYLLGPDPAREAALLDGFAPADLYLLLSPDVVWVDDGTRYGPDDATRAWFFERGRALLEARGLPFRVIGGGDHAGRLARIGAVLAEG